jgi:hypothetical protein
MARSPLKQAENLLNGAHRLLYAAACAAVQPKPNFVGRKPKAAGQFLDE